MQKIRDKTYKSIYIGDNPIIDFAGAKKVGFITIRILRGAYKKVTSKLDVVDFEINDLYELIGVKLNA